jgi:hypothetical protein
MKMTTAKMITPMIECGLSSISPSLSLIIMEENTIVKANMRNPETLWIHMCTFQKTFIYLFESTTINPRMNQAAHNTQPWTNSESAFSPGGPP